MRTDRQSRVTETRVGDILTFTLVQLSPHLETRGPPQVFLKLIPQEIGAQASGCFLGGGKGDRDISGGFPLTPPIPPSPSSCPPPLTPTKILQREMAFVPGHPL